MTGKSFQINIGILTEAIAINMDFLTYIFNDQRIIQYDFHSESQTFL